jgi:cobalt/nickel transport protein
MKYLLIAVMLAVLLALGAFMITYDRNGRWAGVDETVVEHYAAKAGRPAREPFINTDRGDLLLFLFLIAGAGGGFIFGYCFRGIFPPGKSGTDGGPEERLRK